MPGQDAAGREALDRGAEIPHSRYGPATWWRRESDLRPAATRACQHQVDGRPLRQVASDGAQGGRRPAGWPRRGYGRRGKW